MGFVLLDSSFNHRVRGCRRREQDHHRRRPRPRLPIGRHWRGQWPNNLLRAVEYTLSPRTGTISIGGQTFVVTQAPGLTVQFSSASYSISEGAGSVDLTVTRSGDTSGTVSVDFATGNN